MTYKQWSDSLGKADASKVATNYAYTSEVKAQQEKPPLVEVKDTRPINASGYIIYDNQAKKPGSTVSYNTGSYNTGTSAGSQGGSVIHIQRNRQDGSYYMHSDGKVKYVYR